MDIKQSLRYYLNFPCHKENIGCGNFVFSEEQFILNSFEGSCVLLNMWLLPWNKNSWPWSHSLLLPFCFPFLPFSLSLFLSFPFPFSFLSIYKSLVDFFLYRTGSKSFQYRAEISESVKTSKWRKFNIQIHIEKLTELCNAKLIDFSLIQFWF